MLPGGWGILFQIIRLSLKCEEMNPNIIYKGIVLMFYPLDNVHIVSVEKGRKKDLKK